jgi:four helix bundle protein
MTQINSYKDLLVWQKGVDVVTAVYTMSKRFPPEECFALSLQIQRAVVSIVANIAEGHGRGTRNDYAHFLDMANGSIAEVETLLTVARNLSYCDDFECSTIEKQLSEIGKMLRVLRAKLRAPLSPRT